MRNGNNAPIHGSGAVLDVTNQGGSVPVAHRHHGDIALRESTRVMQTGSLQLVIAHADFFILKTLIQLVEVLEVGVLAVSQRIHAVADRPVRHAGEPGVVMRAVSAGLFVDVACHLRVFIPRPIVGRVIHARLIEQILVVEHHPVVGAERERVLLAVGQRDVAGVHARVLAQVNAVRLDVFVQRNDETFLRPVLHVGKLLDAVQVGGVAAGEHGAGLDVVILRSEVNPLDLHIGIRRFIAFLNRGIIRRG